MEFDPSILVGELPFDRNRICVFLFEVGLYFPTGIQRSLGGETIQLIIPP